MLTELAKSEQDLQLQFDYIKHELAKLSRFLPELTNVSNATKELQQYAQDQVTQYALSMQVSNVKKLELKPFFDKPYCIIPAKRQDEWYLLIPKFIDIQLGWLDRTTESYNVFLVNRYTDWLGELPQAIKNELGMKDPLDVFLDGDFIVGPDVKKAHSKYAQFITQKTKDGKLKIDKSKQFELLASLIRDGILPFIPKPIPEEDLTKGRLDYVLRDYQENAWKEFLNYGHVGIFIPPSTGKTVIGLRGLTHIKPKHVVTVPSKLLVQQWTNRIELYTDLRVKSLEQINKRKLKEDLEKIDVIVTTYQSAVKHLSDIEFNLLIIDETHHLPSNEFSKLSFMKCKYVMGLSATPQREDHREEFIFALTGKPYGLDWDNFKKLGIIQSPDCHIWIVNKESKRLDKLAELLHEKKKTIIFCDSIELGKRLSKLHDIPFVFGNSKQKLEILQEAKTVIVSRVGDEGISLPDVVRVIEVSWLFGSRRQELQRMTRLLHGHSKNAEHHIIFTLDEYQHDHKRLFSLMDKGFKITLHREGISEKIIQKIDSGQEKRKPIKIIPKEPKRIEIVDHPTLQLPGVRKRLVGLKKSELLAVNEMFRHEDKKYTMRQLALILGISRADHVGNFSKLVKLGLIKKIGTGEYQADPTLSGALEN